jgi:hypothetical protein
MCVAKQHIDETGADEEAPKEEPWSRLMEYEGSLARYLTWTSSEKVL